MFQGNIMLHFELYVQNDGVVSLGEIKPKSASVQWGEQSQPLPPTSLATVRSNLQLATRDMLQITPRGGHPAIQRLALYGCICGEKTIVSRKWINDQTICCLHHEAATFTDATDFKRLHLT